MAVSEIHSYEFVHKYVYEVCGLSTKVVHCIVNWLFYLEKNYFLKSWKSKRIIVLFT